MKPPSRSPGAARPKRPALSRSIRRQARAAAGRRRGPREFAEPRQFSDDARLVVSEPLGDVAGVWNEVPESSWGVVGAGREEMRPFRPTAPSIAVAVA